MCRVREINRVFRCSMVGPRGERAHHRQIRITCVGGCSPSVGRLETLRPTVGAGDGVFGWRRAHICAMGCQSDAQSTICDRGAGRSCAETQDGKCSFPRVVRQWRTTCRSWCAAWSVVCLHALGGADGPTSWHGVSLRAEHSPPSTSSLRAPQSQCWSAQLHDAAAGMAAAADADAA